MLMVKDLMKTRRILWKAEFLIASFLDVNCSFAKVKKFSFYNRAAKD